MVSAQSEVHIFHAVQGTGGHAMPSNFFGSFLVEGDQGVVYEGVDNAHRMPGPLGLVLTVESPNNPSPEAVDCRCQEASDCMIKDVGNCCGYYPRCVHVNSPSPPPDCSGSSGSVCGWPDISHCACVENVCRSMQGDQEV